MGSIVIVPKVVVDASRDTLIQVTNLTNSTRFARCSYVDTEQICMDMECTLSIVSTEFPLTLRPQQTLSWVASQGQPPDPAAALANLVPPLASDFQGELVCIEVDASFFPVPGNSLTAQATMTRLDGSRVAKYTGFTLPGFDTNNMDNILCLGGSVTGSCPLGPEYAACPAAWALNHMASGVDDILAPNLNVNTSIRAVPCSLDLVDPELQGLTLLFTVHNEFENAFSASVSTSGFDDRTLAGISPIFSEATLGTRHARTQVSSPDGFILIAEEAHDDDGTGTSTAIAPYVEGLSVSQDVITLPDLDPPVDRLEVFTIASGGEPQSIVSGPDGNLWFTGSNDSIGRITPVGSITIFPLPNSASSALGITAGTDGNLWFTEFFGNRIGRITTAGVITEFAIPSAGSQPTGITAGSDGNVWFVESAAGANKIGRITPAGVITEFPIPNVGARWITRGRDGNLWFTETLANKIGRMTTTGVLTEFEGLTSNAFLAAPDLSDGRITAAHDGKIWFTEGQAGLLGSITIAGVVAELDPTSLDDGAVPLGIAAASDGDVWFTTSNNELAPAGIYGFFFGTSEGVALSGAPRDVTTGPDGNLWVAESPNSIERYIVGTPP